MFAHAGHWESDLRRYALRLSFMDPQALNAVFGYLWGTDPRTGSPLRLPPHFHFADETSGNIFIRKEFTWLPFILTACLLIVKALEPVSTWDELWP